MQLLLTIPTTTKTTTKELNIIYSIKFMFMFVFSVCNFIDCSNLLYFGPFSHWKTPRYLLNIEAFVESV